MRGGYRQGIKAHIYDVLVEKKIYCWVQGSKLEEFIQAEDLDSKSSLYHLPLTLAGDLNLSESVK